MAKLEFKVVSTSQTINIFIQDTSSTTGQGLAGLVFNTAGLTAYYALPAATPVAITLVTQTVTGAYSSGGFVELDSTNMKGWYRFDIPDAAIASGRFVSIHLFGAANMAPLPLEIELTGWDNQDAVHGGMSALPNTACTTNASLITSGTGTAQLSVSSGLVVLGATGLDNIPVADPTTVASTYPTMQVQLWRRFFKKVHRDISNNTIKTYKDDGTTVVTTQTTSVSGTDEDVAAAT